MLTFRDANLGDLPGIVGIYNSVVPTRMVTADMEPVSLESRLKWYHDHDPLRRPLWVVETEEGHMAGWVSFQSFYERPAYEATVEISIYLDPAYRGRGLGRKVLQTSLERASTIGLRNIVGFIFAHNEPSMALFTKAGFEQWGYLPLVATLDGMERSVVIMGKKINSPTP